MAQAPQNTKKAPTKRRAAVDPNESKEAKFKRLASVRMSAALKAVRGVANLSGAGYGFTEAQAAQIGTDLDKAVSYVKNSFKNGGPGKQGAAYSI